MSKSRNVISLLFIRKYVILKTDVESMNKDVKAHFFFHFS